MGNSNPPSQKAAPNARPAGRNADNQGTQQPEGYSVFSPKQRQALLKRYQFHDSSPQGKDGIPVEVCLAMPEFVGNKLISVLIHDFLSPRTGRMHPQEFLQFCSFLSSNTRLSEKKRMLYDSFNVYGTESFTHDEIFRMYKVLLGHVISDDQILALTFEALQHPSLKKQGEISKEEFIRMVPDSEIEQKLTIYFNLPAA